MCAIAVSLCGRVDGFHPHHTGVFSLVGKRVFSMSCRCVGLSTRGRV